MSTPVSENTEFEIAVFGKGDRTSGLPRYRVSRDQAAEWESMGLARWVNNRRKSIIMIVEAALLKIRDASCQMGPSVIEQAACGSHHHQVLAAAWSGRDTLIF